MILVEGWMEAHEHVLPILLILLMWIKMMEIDESSIIDIGPQDDGSPRVCLALPGLTEQQANVCEKLPETVESVPFGTKQVGLYFKV